MHMATAEDEQSIPKAIVSGRVAKLRLATGLLQGVILYALYWLFKNTALPNANMYLFAPLVLCALFVPILFVSGLGHLDNRRITKWMIGAALICMLLTVCDVWRSGHVQFDWLSFATVKTEYSASAWLLTFLPVGFYIAHALVLAAARDGRKVATYPSYFEMAWKLIIQIMFALLFVGVLWLILWLGANLFMLIKLSFLHDLLQRPWFFVTATTFAFATALHITDVRPGIVRGIRSLLLVLMSWLLPITTLIVGGFLLSLPFAGLEPLWATRHATSVLLGATAVLVLLINATFQGGQLGTQVTAFLRIVARVACALLLPMTLIAIYSLTLRVEQYGWTTDRIIAAACLLVASCYACGYFWAAVERKVWLERIAPVNVMTAFVILGALLALFTPIADPARLSVNDQVARLESGKVSAAKFDFNYLRFDGARYGNEVLQKFKLTTTGPDVALLNKRAEEALQRKNKWDGENRLPVADKIARLANITVWPDGKSLPASFAEMDWSAFEKNHLFPQCLLFQDKKCDVYLMDLNGDNKTEILIKNAENFRQAVVFSLQTDGKWQPTGLINGMSLDCKDVSQALAEGRYQLLPTPFKDVQIAGQRLSVEAWPTDQSKCADAKN